MDFGTINESQTAVLAVVFMGIFIGRMVGAQQAILSGMIVLAIIAPLSFPTLGMALIILAVIAKWGSQWISWL